MKGLELKKKLREDGINLSDLAKSLGYDNDQRLHSALNAADVKSGLIEKIAKMTNKTVGYYYEQIDRFLTLLEKQGHTYMSMVADT